MVYAIIGIVVVVALFLIFREDHDNSYNKKEKGYRQPEQKYQKKASGAGSGQEAGAQSGQASGAQSGQEPGQSKWVSGNESRPGSGQEAGAESGPGSQTKGPKPEFGFGSEARKVIGMIGSIIEEVKKEAAEPLKDIRDGMRDVVDETRAAIDKAMREAGHGTYWTTSLDVDEQEQPEDDGAESQWNDESGWTVRENEEDEERAWENEEEGEEGVTDMSFLDELDYYEDLEENTETFDVTGLRYHCSVHDCGQIVGYVKPEPSNVHDSRAQAVIRRDGKLLGYIPRTQLDWYEEFNEQNVVCPFVGEIEVDRRSANLIAEIKVIIPVSREFVEMELEDGV